MSDLDLQTLEKAIVFVGEPDEQVRKSLRQILTHAGLRQVSVHGNLKNIQSLMSSMTPDLILLSDELDPGVFDFIRDIRHNKMGNNPFVVITTLIAPENKDSVKKAMSAGTDDIVIKPIKEEQLLQRLKRVTVNRSAFVVTSDYLGPDRRGKNRPSNIRRVNVLNTMLEKANGRDVDLSGVKDAVDGSMHDVLQARLDSHGYRLGFVCKLILKAHEEKEITPEIQEQLVVLVDLLADAAKTAERLEEPDLAILCGSLSKDVAKLVERYENLTAEDIALIEKLSVSVVAAIKPQTPPEKIDEEVTQAAENYESREREGFEEPVDIQKAPDDASLEDFDEPVIEILPLPKGEYLFKTGDEAKAAYILNYGTIAIFADKDGKRVPVARVKKGEFFGEMAIIDGRPRRNSAMALEDCTLSIVSKDMIEEKLVTSDKMIRMVLNMLSNSLKTIHEAYGPKGRNIVDSVREMKEQALHVQSYVENVAGQAVKDESTAAVTKIIELTEKISKLVAKLPELDRRTPAVPSEEEVKN